MAEEGGGTGGYTYKWKSGTSDAGTNANLSITKASTYTATEANTYMALVTRDGCSANAPSITLQMVLAMEPTPGSLDLAISPNPVQQSTQVRLNLFKAAPATFTIVDASGRTAGEWQATQTNTTHELTLPLKTYPAGSNFITVNAFTSH